MGCWRKTTVEQYAAWIGETGSLSVCIVPGLGSKVISLQNRETGREWLWRSGKPLGNLGYGSSFSAGDESGWDEMFPGIDACDYPLKPWQGEPIPDHGEVWPLSWEHQCTGSSLHCSVAGVKFPYLLEKEYSFAADGTLRIDYALTNRAEAPFTFLWAAHPLLQIHEGMKLHIPGGLSEIEVSYSEGERLGVFGDKRAWPFVRTGGGIADLSVMEPPNGHFAEKYYFTGRLDSGMAGISDPATGEALTFIFPPDQVPYLAIWANYGGFHGYYHLAVEPATGRMDNLRHAIEQNEAAIVQPGCVYRWFLGVSIT